jgi:hypothetical protein
MKRNGYDWGSRFSLVRVASPPRPSHSGASRSWRRPRSSSNEASHPEGDGLAVDQASRPRVSWSTATFEEPGDVVFKHAARSAVRASLPSRADAGLGEGQEPGGASGVARGGGGLGAMTVCLQGRSRKRIPPGALRDEQRYGSASSGRGNEGSVEEQARRGLWERTLRAAG